MSDPAAIEATMLGLLARRAADASICPSEVARALQPDAWRSLMPAVRDVAGRLAGEGVVRVTQGAVSVPAAGVVEAVGPIRLRRGPAVQSIPEVPRSPASPADRRREPRD